MGWRNIAAVVFVFFLLGCGQPTVDASSEEAFRSSVAKVRESLPIEQRGHFDEALHLLVFSRIDAASLLSGEGEGIGSLDDEALKVVHGKTAGHIIAEAARKRR